VNQYHIQTEVFEGPLELLLSLIEKRKLLINDIALAEVANDFLTYLEQHPEFPVSETAQFVLVGSTLLLIKSKSLLPVFSLTSEESTSIEDLTARLRQLELYKKRGTDIIDRYGAIRLYGRQQYRKRTVTFSPLKDCTTPVLYEAIQRVLHTLPKEKQSLAQTTVKKVVSLDDMMDRLTTRINNSMRISFRQFAGTAPKGKVNLIVTFLAMLELVRQGVIRVEQEQEYGEIQMESDRVEVPRYG